MRTAAAEARRRCRRIGGSLKLDGSSVLIARPYDKNQIAKNKLAPEWGDFQTLATPLPPLYGEGGRAATGWGGPGDRGSASEQTCRPHPTSPFGLSHPPHEGEGETFHLITDWRRRVRC